MKGYYPVLMSIFQKHGVVFVRKGNGDHEIWRLGNKQTTVDKGVKNRHTANAVLKQLGLKERL